MSLSTCRDDALRCKIAGITVIQWADIARLCLCRRTDSFRHTLIFNLCGSPEHDVL